MPEADPQQLFVRTEQGRRWGPITPGTLELLIDNGLIEGRIQISLDGQNFAWPGHFPEVRDFVPRGLWGDGALPQANVAPTIAPLPGLGAGGSPSPVLVRPGPGPIQSASPRPAAPVLVPVATAVLGSPPVALRQAPPTQAPPRLEPVVPPPPPQAPEFAPYIGVRMEPPAAGDLSSVSPTRLYYLAASSDATGLLTLRLSERVVEIHFRKGNPEYVGSTHPDDAVDGFLLRQGLSTPEQIAQTRAAAERFGGDLVAALFGLGILNPTTAFAHLAQRAQGILLRALLANAGRFEWAAKDLPAHKAMPLGNRWGVLMDIVRRVPIPEIRHRLGPVLDNPVMKSGGQVALSELRFSPQEMRAIGYIDGVRSLAMLAHDMPHDADTFFRLAWVLGEMDIVSFAATKLAPPPPPPVAPSPHPVPAEASTPRTTPAARPRDPTTPPPRLAPAAPPRAATPAAPPGPVDFAAEIKRLRELNARRTGQNHFQLLGIDEKADAAALKVAYFKMAKHHHPDTVPPDAPPELAQLKAEMFASVGEAYRTLSDETSRQRYLEELQHGAGEVDVAQLLRADDLFQRGCILVKAKKFAEAVQTLSDAIALNPEEGEFYAWRGVARFFAAADLKQSRAEAERDLGMALAKNPRCAQAYYFLGQLAKLLGDTSGAIRQFQKALEIQPEHVESQREIRYLQRKK